MTSGTETTVIFSDLALRQSGAHRRRIFAGIIAISIIAGACSSTFPTADSSTAEDQVGEANTQPSVPTLAGDILPTSPGLAITIDRVSDGDSVRASSDQGDLEIRLIGVNAPEADECFGDSAAEILASILDREEVTLHPWPAELDDFGRELGFLVAGDQFVNLALVEQGAVVARAQSDHDFVTEFENAEAAASSAEVGLWAPDACGEPSGSEVEIVDANADAPGNDQENPNGEWIEIENVGNAPASLDNWSLRDESTRHRYDFPATSLQPGQRVRIFTGCGADTPADDPGELFWCSPEPPVWNNGGDTAFLLDANGSIVDSRSVGG